MDISLSHMVLATLLSFQTLPLFTVCVCVCVFSMAQATQKTLQGLSLLKSEFLT